MKIANFAEATALLDGFIPRPIDVRAVYNLETISALMQFLGEPQNSLKVIHVAGTSGKTSTSYYAAALLKAAGKKVGLTVSPHIEQITDRVQINLEPMPEVAFCTALGEFMDEVQRSGLKPTYFELMMAFAYWEFARQKVDYAVIEVGLGGLLDGSNVVTRPDKVCVITDIGLDHTGILGSTLPEIATQKAGIIHPGNMVFVYEQAPEVMDVVRAVCADKHADLQVVDSTVEKSVDFLPRYQQRNIVLARAVVSYALHRDEQITVTPEMTQQAAHVRIPGRMEVFKIDDKIIILDGAHNPQKLRAMTESLHVEYPDQPVAAIVGFIQSKEINLQENAQILGEITGHVVTTDFAAAQEHGQPAIEPETVAAAFREAGVRDVLVTSDVKEALRKLLDSPEEILLVTGSLYLISYVRPHVIALSK